MKNIIGIRREDLSKKGEKRVAVVPDLVRKLSEWNIQLSVQSCTHPETAELKRAYTDEAYIGAGAKIAEDLSGTRVIFGLKEVEVDKILEKKAYLMFSHTHKGQVKNRKLLQVLKDKKTTLIDYELITDEAGKRLITAFTYFAGYAGMIDSLWTYGQRLKQQGFTHPFAQIPQSIEKEDLQLIKNLIVEVGKQIKENGTPPDQPPMIVCFLGTGKTSWGAQQIYDILPGEKITLDQLEEIYTNGSRHKVYKLVLGTGDMFRIKKDSSFFGKGLDYKTRRSLYLEFPEHFESKLDEVLPYCSMLMNCILWSPKYPRLLSYDDAAIWYAKSQTLKVIGDITCDPEGSIEFSRETWIDDPVFVYDPASRKFQDGFEGEGIALMGVTNLPCEFAADSSSEFSENLEPLLEGIVHADYEAATQSEAGLPAAIERAVILWNGEFTPDYAYMQSFLND